MIINNKEEFEIFYPYDKKYIKEYPKVYPCLAKWEDVEGGLMGDYRQVYVAYFPQKDLTPNEAFMAGTRNPWEKIK